MNSHQGPLLSVGCMRDLIMRNAVQAANKLYPAMDARKLGAAWKFSKRICRECLKPPTKHSSSPE